MRTRSCKWCGKGIGDVCLFLSEKKGYCNATCEANAEIHLKNLNYSLEQHQLAVDRFNETREFSYCVKLTLEMEIRRLEKEVIEWNEIINS